MRSKQASNGTDDAGPGLTSGSSGASSPGGALCSRSKRPLLEALRSAAGEEKVSSGSVSTACRWPASSWLQSSSSSDCFKELLQLLDAIPAVDRLLGTEV